MKKKITILFNGVHLSYSPTVIGLYDLLFERFDVTILGDDPKDFDNKLLTNRKVVYKKPFPRRIFAIFYALLYRWRSFFDNKIAALRKSGFAPRTIYDFEEVRKYLENNDSDIIVAVDFKNLFYAQMLEKKAEFLSLEIPANDEFYKHCDFKNISSVVIQTGERYEHLFENKAFTTFYIQNSPIFRESSNTPKRENLVYCGTAWNPFGFYHCLDVLRKFPEYALNVKGAILTEDKLKIQTDYKDLIDEKRLIIDSQYLDDSEVVGYLRQFRIGFCFYNFEIDWVDTFNYHSAPSGKMFKYFAAGVPVIGQNILGLKPVSEFDCGVLIEDLTPESIKKAIDKIEANFNYYSQNCYKAAAHYSFDKTAKPFVNYLIDKSAATN